MKDKFSLISELEERNCSELLAIVCDVSKFDAFSFTFVDVSKNLTREFSILRFPSANISEFFVCLFVFTKVGICDSHYKFSVMLIVKNLKLPPAPHIPEALVLNTKVKEV